MSVGLCVYAFIAYSATMRQSILALTWFNDGEWSLITQSQSHRSALLASPVFVTAYLTVLRFKLTDPAGQVCYAVLSVDNCDPQSFRRLRIRLLQAHTAG